MSSVSVPQEIIVSIPNREKEKFQQMKNTYQLALNLVSIPNREKEKFQL